MSKPKGDHSSGPEELHMRVQQKSPNVKTGRHDQYFFYAGKYGGNEEMDDLNREEAEKKPCGQVKNRKAQNRSLNALLVPLGARKIDELYPGGKEERQKDQEYVEKDEGDETGGEALFQK